MRLIDADEFIKKLAMTPLVQEAMRKAVNHMPTVEVVRCKDCRWGTAVEHEFVQGADIRCQQHNCFTNHDSFCSSGEKKDGNT